MKKTTFRNAGQKAFKKIGDAAIGNGKLDENTPIMPFSLTHTWIYEKPMPKRKSK